METIRFAAESVCHPEGTHVATCAATPGCRETGPPGRSARDALRGAVRDFLPPAIKNSPQVGSVVLVVACGIRPYPPSKRKSGTMAIGWVERKQQQ